MFILVKGKDDLNDYYELRINRKHIETIEFVKEESGKFFYNIGMISGRFLKEVYSDNNQISTTLSYIR
tara:strand:- start:613 stop:816 length:204 start_codon:yes stop_codon:yes gene_type:complete